MSGTRVTELSTQKSKMQRLLQHALHLSASIDRDCRFDDELFQAIHQHKLAAPFIPSEYGGLGWRHLATGQLHESVGRICTNFRSLLTVQGIVASAIMRWGTSAQKAAFLPRLTGGCQAAICISETQAGSDVSSIEARATISGSELSISGVKRWVTFGCKAKILLVLVQTEDGPTSVLVERNTKGLTIERETVMLGLRGSELGKISMDNVRVPKENVLSKVGVGALTTVATGLDFGRYSIAWGSIGMVAACLQEANNYSGHRLVGGKPIRQHQFIQGHLAEMTTGLRLCQEHLKSLAALRDNKGDKQITETALAKYATSKLAMKSTWRTLQVLGAKGYEAHSRTERFFRDAKVIELIEGTHEIQKSVLSTLVVDATRPMA